MKLFIISAFILVVSSIANADYSIKNVYKFDNIDMIKNIDNSSIINMTVNGVSEDSNGTFKSSAPTTTGDYARVVGYAVNDDAIYFCPDNTWVLIG